MKRRPAILIDVGGVLLPDHLSAAATAWGSRLGIAPDAFLAALFGGNDDRVLVGRTSETAWWCIVAGRLGIDGDLATEIRGDLAARETWDTALLTGLRRLRGQARIAIVSNAWPQARTSIVQAGLHRLADAVILSCEVGYAKPDPRIYVAALEATRTTDPADALFIDDTLGHVEAARSLGMAGHVHADSESTLHRIEQFVHARPITRR